MPPEETTEEQRLAQLQEARLAEEMAAGEATAGKTPAAKPAEEHFINSGEATLLFAFYGAAEIVQQIVDWLNLAFGLGVLINGIITFVVGFIFFIWLTGKIAKGAPKKWYKTVYYGAAGGIIPIIPGYLGVIIYLYLEDHQLLKKAFGKIGEVAGKMMKK